MDFYQRKCRNIRDWEAAEKELGLALSALNSRQMMDDLVNVTFREGRVFRKDMMDEARGIMKEGDLHRASQMSYIRQVINGCSVQVTTQPLPLISALQACSDLLSNRAIT